MESSSNRIGLSSRSAHADRSDGSPRSKRSSDPCLRPPAPTERVPSPPAELRFRIRWTKHDLSSHPDPQNTDSCTVATCSDQGLHSFTSNSECGKFMSREKADDTLRSFDLHAEDIVRSTKRSRKDDQTIGGGPLEENRNRASKEGKHFRKGFGTETRERQDRDLQFLKDSSLSHTKPCDQHPSAKKAEEGSVKCGHSAQTNGQRLKLVSSVTTRLPHKKAFKTMRALTEVRDCVVEKPADRSCTNTESRASPSKSVEGVENERESQSKRTLAECNDYVKEFPFVLPPILKRARSSRDVQGHKKLETTERNSEDVRTKGEEAIKEGLCVSKVVEVGCRDLDSLEKVQGEEAVVLIKGDDSRTEPSTDSEGAKTKSILVARSSSSEVKSRVESPLQTEGTCAAELNAGDRQGVLGTNTSNESAEVAEDRDCSAPKEEKAGHKSLERSSPQVSESEDEEAPRVSSNEAGRDRTWHEASHEMPHEVVVGDRPDDQRRHEIVRDVVEGPLTTSHLLATEMSGTTIQGEQPWHLLDGVSVAKEHPLMQRSAIHKERDMSAALANSADLHFQNIKGLIMTEDYKSKDQLKRVPGLQAYASPNDKDCIADKVGSYVTQGKPSEVESFQLSLALPSSLAAEAGDVSNAKSLPFAPASASQTETQNFSHSQKCSDGCTASLSFSHSLLHNPSCSLGCFSVDNQELSCGGTRFLSQGYESMPTRGQPMLSSNEHDGSLSLFGDKSKQGQGVPSYHWPIQSGSQQSGRIHENNASLQEAPVVPWKSKLSTDDCKGFVTHGIIHQDLQIGSFQQEERGQDLAEAWSKRPVEKSKVNHPVSSAKRGGTAKCEGVRGDENQLGRHFGLQEIVSEPVGIMAQRMQELPDSFLDSLRGLARDLLCSFEKRGEFLALQRLVKSRRDLTEDILLRAQRTQLEIFVALKTGEQAFVQVGTKPLTYKALTEIFLQSRCRNVTCQQSLPVDGCDCKVCSQKVGFCHECMCVVCSKFDSDNHTCRWVGCEFCMHWCHADCGLRMSYIAPAQSNKGAAGTTEMQYRCVTCGHSSELFGLVKNVFQLFSKNWDAEAFTKELDCVRRIFHGSEDLRGRQLCRKAEILLQEMDMKVDVANIRQSILQHFSEADSHAAGARAFSNKQSTSSKVIGAVNGKVRTTLEASSQVAPMVGDKLADERMMREFCAEKIENITELRVGHAQKRAEIDNIHSMVRLKQAEAEMLQQRADEAHKQARGLQQIISVKQDKIEGDYMCKYAKLRLNEAEEKRSRSLLELQALERAHLDYQSMKLRMEAQIKNLAMRMGRASWQYA